VVGCAPTIAIIPVVNVVLGATLEAKAFRVPAVAGVEAVPAAPAVAQVPVLEAAAAVAAAAPLSPGLPDRLTRPAGGSPGAVNS